MARPRAGATALRFGLATVVWLVIADQATKSWAFGAGRTGVVTVQNPHAALGSVHAPGPWLIGLAIVSVVGFCVVLGHAGWRLGIPAWIPGLVVGGAVSNLIDRVRFGAVRDFIVTRWGIFNLADLFVIAGVVLLPLLIATRTIHRRRLDADPT